MVSRSVPSEAGALTNGRSVRTLTAAADLATVLADRRPQIERDRRVPPDLMRSLTEAGMFRMLVPRDYGGTDLDLTDALRVIETLATADAATGWTVAIGCCTPLVCSFLPRATFEQIYAGGPDVVAAGAFAPKGTARETGEGWRVTGQWPFVSGCEHATLFYLHCAVVPLAATDVPPEPQLRMMFVPAQAIRIRDTWHTVGLRGTGSHDVRATGALCPDDWSARVFGARPSVGGRAFAIPPMDHLGLFIAAVAIGTASGALQDVVALAAGGKRPAFSRGRLLDSVMFLDRVGEAHMKLVAARAMLNGQAGEAWARVASGSEPTVLERTVLRATASHVTAVAAEIVTTAYNLSGGSAVFDASPVQQRLRDVNTITQHAVTSRDFLGNVGAAVAGEPVTGMV